MNNFSIKLKRGSFAEHKAVDGAPLCRRRMIVMMLTRDAESRTNLKYLLIIFKMKNISCAFSPREERRHLLSGDT